MYWLDDELEPHEDIPEVEVEPDPFADFARFIHEPEPWRDDAACNKLDMPVRERLAIFFPERGNRSHKLAKKTCASCPVGLQCEAFRAKSGSEYGIWNGKIQRRSGAR